MSLDTPIPQAGCRPSVTLCLYHQPAPRPSPMFDPIRP